MHRQASGRRRPVAADDLVVTEHRAESEELAELVLYALQEFVIKEGLTHWTSEAIAKTQAGLKRAKEHFIIRVRIARMTLEKFDKGIPAATPKQIKKPTLTADQA